MDTQDNVNVKEWTHFETCFRHICTVVSFSVSFICVIPRSNHMALNYGQKDNANAQEWRILIWWLRISSMTTSTSMHSSRMRTGRSLTVCWRCLLRGVSALRGMYLLWGACLLWGMCLLWGGCLLQGVSAPGGVAGIPACTEADTLSPLLTELQTPVKTLPWPNFVAAGKNDHCCYSIAIGFWRYYAEFCDFFLKFTFKNGQPLT